MKIGLIGTGRQGKRMLLPENGGDMLVMGDSGQDAVVIATPTPTHFELVKRHLERGQHVLCEKPLAETYEQVDELVSLAEQKGLQLMCCHTYLHDANFAECMRMALTMPNCSFGVRAEGREVYSWLPHLASMFVAMGEPNWKWRFDYSEKSRLGAFWSEGVLLPDRLLQWWSDVPSEPTPMRRQLEAFIRGDWDEDLRAVYRIVEEMKHGKRETVGGSTQGAPETRPN